MTRQIIALIALVFTLSYSTVSFAQQQEYSSILARQTYGTRPPGDKSNLFKTNFDLIKAAPPHMDLHDFFEFFSLEFLSGDVLFKCSDEHNQMAEEDSVLHIYANNEIPGQGGPYVAITRYAKDEFNKPNLERLFQRHPERFERLRKKFRKAAKNGAGAYIPRHFGFSDSMAFISETFAEEQRLSHRQFIFNRTEYHFRKAKDGRWVVAIKTGQVSKNKKNGDIKLKQLDANNIRTHSVCVQVLPKKVRIHNPNLKTPANSTGASPKTQPHNPNFEKPVNSTPVSPTKKKRVKTTPIPLPPSK